jgi:periplasmic divalent cation tolerance protein
MAQRGGNDGVVLIYATFPSRQVASDIARALVEERLAACANVMAAMTSVYEWQGKLETTEEVPAVFKTRGDLSEAAVARLQSLHPYETPAILVLPVAGGFAPFLAWVAGQTGPR